MVEPDHIVESPELAAEMDAILARFGAEAVVRVVAVLAEQDAVPSAPHAERGGQS